MQIVDIKTVLICFCFVCVQRMLLNINIFIAEPECAGTTGALVDGNPPIPDDHFYATSESQGYWVATFARMSSGSAWCATPQERSAAVLNFYLQVRTYFTNKCTSLQ